MRRGLGWRGLSGWDNRRGGPTIPGVRRAIILVLLVAAVFALCTTGFMAAYRPDVLRHLFG